MRNPSALRWITPFALFNLVALMTMCPAHADDSIVINVDTTNDEADDDRSDNLCRTASASCSLRAAVMQANLRHGPSIIILPAGTYVLSIPADGIDQENNGDDKGDLNLTAPLDNQQKIAIVGAGTDRTIIDGNHASRAFDIGQGRIVDISDITIRNGLGFNGGGIQSHGKLTLFRCVIEDNWAGRAGGGIASGSLFDDASSQLTVVASTIRRNVVEDGDPATDGNGGGIYSNGSTLIRDSTIHSNGTTNGGGIFNARTLYVVNSTISGNYANSNGGGIFSNAAQSVTALYNTSVINNNADHDRDELGGSAGGIYAGAYFSLANSLVSHNTRFNAPIADDCQGTAQLYGRNLFGNLGGCSLGGNGAASAGLVSLSSIGPLQDNGGPTQTHALLPGSQAINSGGYYSSQGCVDESGLPLSRDQLGAARAMGGRCDVGAYEFPQ